LGLLDFGQRNRCLSSIRILDRQLFGPSKVEIPT
jgi:hypothetical protein